MPAPGVSKLVGSAEAQRVLRLSSAQFRRLVNGGQIKPVATLAAGDVFALNDLAALARERARRANSGESALKLPDLDALDDLAQNVN